MKRVEIASAVVLFIASCGICDDSAEFARALNVGAAAAIVDGSITNRPVFDVSDAEEMMNPNTTEDDIFLALAKHVPALSHPVGGTDVVFGARIENHDLNEENVYRSGWGRTHRNFGVSWLHSDMKDMAYFYVYKLYDEVVKEKGNLK